MPRYILILTAIVKDGERGLLTRKGRFKRVLAPGCYIWFDPRRKLDAEVFGTVRAEFPADRYKMIKASRPDVARQLFAVVETGAHEIAVVNFDGRPAHLFGPSSLRVFWKVTTSVSAERIDVAVDPRIVAHHFRMLWRLKEIESVERLIEKVGRTGLHGGSAGLDALLARLVWLQRPEAAPESWRDTERRIAHGRSFDEREQRRALIPLEKAHEPD